MPKKRFTPQYSKPQSTVHPSLSSPATSSSSTNRAPLYPASASTPLFMTTTNLSLWIDNDAPPTVNDLISSLRKSSLSTNLSAPNTITTRTLPPQIRHLLSQPETPGPKPRARDRRRFDANGRRIPAGPAPPRSWLEGSRHAPLGLRGRGQERVFPTDVTYLPGLAEEDADSKGKRLQDMCLRCMSRNWEFVREYERNNLADLPSRLRMLLLSNIAVYGPDDGVGFEGLKNLLVLPSLENGEPQQFDSGEQNEGFFRLDLSGAIGHSVTFKQLTELVQKPTPVADDQEELSWEENLSRSLSPPIPHLTHLSLSHPPPSISWPRLLAFSKHIPTLTHLSLAFWPVPSLTPNAKTAVVESRFGKDIQYGGTNYYSHSLDNDFREAAEVLRRLAGRLYGLEYLDLTGCSEWLRALRWTGDISDGDRGVYWGAQWVKLHMLKLFSGLTLEDESEYCDVVRFVQAYKEALATEEMLGWWMRRGKEEGKRNTWIEVQKDDWKGYEALWNGEGVQERKRRALDSLGRTSGEEAGGWRSPIVFELDAPDGTVEGAVERRSVWEQ